MFLLGECIAPFRFIFILFIIFIPWIFQYIYTVLSKLLRSIAATLIFMFAVYIHYIVILAIYLLHNICIIFIFDFPWVRKIKVCSASCTLHVWWWRKEYYCRQYLVVCIITFIEYRFNSIIPAFSRLRFDVLSTKDSPQVSLKSVEFYSNTLYWCNSYMSVYISIVRDLSFLQ